MKYDSPKMRHKDIKLIIHIKMNFFSNISCSQNFLEGKNIGICYIMRIKGSMAKNFGSNKIILMSSTLFFTAFIGIII